MATKTRRKRTTIGSAPPGKESWAILDSKGRLLRDTGYGAGPALIVTQKMAEKAEEETSFTIERRSLFGPAAPLYRVVRTEDGHVITTTISNED